MEEKNKTDSTFKKVIKRILASGEDELCGVMFIFLMVLLTIQVISRYVFRHSFPWTEELAVFVFVWMSFLGIAGSIKPRRHIRIDAFISILPFKVRKIFLIAADIVFIGFCLYVLPPFMEILGTLGGATTPLLKIPKILSYIVIPICFVLTPIRLIQDIIKLIGENEENLGVKEAMIDIKKDEIYYLVHKKGMTEEEAAVFIRNEEKADALKYDKKKKKEGKAS